MPLIAGLQRKVTKFDEHLVFIWWLELGGALALKQTYLDVRESAGCPCLPAVAHQSAGD
jgi:hypothetical protein